MSDSCSPQSDMEDLSLPESLSSDRRGHDAEAADRSSRCHAVHAVYKRCSAGLETRALVPKRRKGEKASRSRARIACVQIASCTITLAPQRQEREPSCQRSALPTKPNVYTHSPFLCLSQV